MSNLPVPEDVQPAAKGTMLDLTLIDKKCGIIGGGILGSLLCTLIQEAATASSIQVATHWAFDSKDDTSSFRAGAYHAPFNTLNPRMGEWAKRSWDMFDVYERLGVSHLIQDTPTLYLSNLTPMPLPQGLPSPAQRVDPADFGFRQNYARAAFVEEGRVFSPPALMDGLHSALARNPNIIVDSKRHFRDVEDIVAWARKRDLRAVFVAPGASGGRLFGHEEVQGSLGVLIHVPMSPELGLHNDTVVMDEDHSESLSYTIPSPAMRTVGVGGTVEQLFDLPFSPGAEYTEDFREFWDEIAYYAQQEAKKIRARVGARFPLMTRALASASHKMTYALRPHSGEVILRVLPPIGTDGILIAELGGLGGSGMTIAPAVAEAALALPSLVEATTSADDIAGD